MTTKDRITEEALTLFAEKGYKGTSVKNIADAVGIKDASLYNHFKSKQEIFDSIVELIMTHISGLSETLGMPQYDKQYTLTSDFYRKLDLEGFICVLSYGSIYFKVLANCPYGAIFKSSDLYYVSKDIYGQCDFLSGTAV